MRGISWLAEELLASQKALLHRTINIIIIIIIIIIIVKDASSDLLENFTAERMVDVF
jgi:hypothetical protein